MQTILFQQIDMNDLKSILENHRQELKKEIKEILLNSSQCPVLIPRKKLKEMLDCSASWLSKVTTSGLMPSISIAGRKFYDLKEIAKKDVFQKCQNKTKVLKK